MDEAATAALMSCCLAREIEDRDVVGVGLGTPLGLVAALLARRVHARGAQLLCSGAVSPDATAAVCMGGASAMEGRVAGYANHVETMEMAERGAMTLQFLRPAQVDEAANTNVSRVGADGGTMRLPGGLATADVTRIMPRIVLYHTDHRARSLPRQVAYRTSAGGGDPEFGRRGPVALITDRAVLEWAGEGWRVRSRHEGNSADDVQENTGFELGGAQDAPATPAPTDDELAALAEVDELALRELEFRGTRAAAAARLAATHH